MLLWNFPLEQKHAITCWTGLEQWHPSLPRLRLSSLLCQLQMSRWLAMARQQDRGNCTWNAEILLEDSGCLWCEAHWVSTAQDFRQWNTLQRTGAVGELPRCSGCVLGCGSCDSRVAAPGVEVSRQLMALVGLEGRVHRELLQCFRPWGLKFLWVTQKSVKWDFFSSKKVLLFHTSQL